MDKLWKIASLKGPPPSPANPSINTIPSAPKPSAEKPLAEKPSDDDEIVVRSIPGIIARADGRIPGYIPAKQHISKRSKSKSYSCKCVNCSSTDSENVPMLDVMVEDGMSEKWWRITEITSEGLEDCCASIFCVLISLCMCGLPFCIAPKLFCGGRNSFCLKNQKVSSFREKTFANQGRNWRYIAVPEVPIDWVLLQQHFNNIKEMEKVAMLAANQRPLSIFLPDQHKGPPLTPTVAPGGQWTRIQSRSSVNGKILVRLVDDHLLVFKFFDKAIEKVWPVPHGIQTPVTITQAADIIFAKEREAMEALANSSDLNTDGDTYAVAIWPSIQFVYCQDLRT